MNFRQAAVEAGFSNKQIAFMEEYVAQTGHIHSAEDITGLETVVGDLLEESDDEDGEDEEEE